MTRLGIITAYPRDDWHSQRLIAAARRVAEVQVIAPTELSARIEGGAVEIAIAGERASRFDAFLLARALGDRGDPDVQIELYRLLREQGSVVINGVDALLSAEDKLRTSALLARAGLPTPRLRLCQRQAEARAAVEAMGRGGAIVKPVYGSLGDGVERVARGAEGAATLAAHLARYGAVYVQQLVSGIRRDVRAFVVGERVVAAIARRPRRGVLAANVHLGAAVEAYRPGRDVRALATAAARAVGLEYTGVDLLEAGAGTLVLEVNGTPRWEGIYRATGRDMAEAIVERALELAQARGAAAAPHAGVQGGVGRWPRRRRARAT